MAENAGPLAISVDGGVLAEAIRALGATHIVCVPDTFLRSAIAELVAKGSPCMLTVCTEDEAMGINAGLYMAGHKPMLLIQNNGLFASVNTLKSIAVDAQVPTFMVIGQYGRDVNKPIEENPLRAVRLLEPTLRVWDVPFARIESAQDLPLLRALWDQAWAENRPAAALIGAPTS
jgi:sulfopyruvate decarboxylase subunit alpha